MRILHLTSTFSGGGIATSLWHLVPFLEQTSDLENEIAGLYEIGRFGERLAALGIPAHNLELTSKYDPRGVPRLSALVRSGKFDLVHAQGWPSILYTAVVSLAHPQLRYVVSEQNVTNRRRRWHLKPLERFLYSRFGQIVAVSVAAKQALLAYLPETALRVTLVYNALDRVQLEPAIQTRDAARAALGLSQDRPVILSGGGLEHKKGIDVLLHALARLHQAHPALAPLTLIASEGPQRAMLEALTAQLGLQSRVRFIGFRNDLPLVMSAADVLVSSSRWEGCPMVILEGMALSLPIVATAVGGVPELIENQVNGVLVPSENPQALADALERVLVNRAWAIRLGCAAQQRVEQFTVQTQAPHLIRLYHTSAHV